VLIRFDSVAHRRRIGSDAPTDESAAPTLLVPQCASSAFAELLARWWLPQMPGKAALRQELFPLLGFGYVEGREMINSLMLLAFEANGVIALRMMKLMRGDRSARREAELMVSEKINAAFEAAAGLIAGASSETTIHRYRRHVKANAKRSRKRALRRTRSRRK
jgi:hypothetical protein